MVYTKKDLEEIREEFLKIGITDEGKMVGILNSLDQIAEIGYCIYKQETKKTLGES